MVEFTRLAEGAANAPGRSVPFTVGFGETLMHRDRHSLSKAQIQLVLDVIFAAQMAARGNPPVLREYLFFALIISLLDPSPAPHDLPAALV